MSAPELERLGYRAALSLRCADAVRRTVVAEGLAAYAWREGDPNRRLPASRSPVSGLLGFGMLPGLSGFQRVRAAGGTGLSWPPAPAPDPYLVSVVDGARRYLPVLLRVDVPILAPVDVALHSAVTRSPATGWGVIRGEVHDRGTGVGVGWAVVEITAAGTPYEVVADGRGRFLLLAPYPEALPPLAGSPPAGPGLGAMSWPLTVAVRSEPGHLVRPAGTNADADPPELGSILGQAAAEQEVGGALQPTSAADLTFGTATVLTLDIQPT